MATLKEKPNLEPLVKEELGELLSKLRPAFMILKLLNDVLTPDEARLVGDAGISRPADPRDWVSPKRIVRVIAEQRQLSLERALVELSLHLDLVGIGRYRRLRKAIGEPVEKPPEVPVWDAKAAELRFQNQVVRSVDIGRGKNIVAILTAFQKVGWRPWIANPLHKNPNALGHAVETLNESLQRIRFARAEGGVTWRELTR